MAKQRTYTDEEFIDAVKKSRSWNQVFQNLGLKVGGSQYTQFKKLANKLGLDISHMSGKGWRKGCKIPPYSIPLGDILVENSSYTNSHRLKKRLFSNNLLEEKCSRCGSIEWFDEKNHLQLDHINGKSDDHRIENLRILCANCHSLTETWTGRNISK
jgi:hypothetical protein